MKIAYIYALSVFTLTTQACEMPHQKMINEASKETGGAVLTWCETMWYNECRKVNDNIEYCAERAQELCSVPR